MSDIEVLSQDRVLPLYVIQGHTERQANRGWLWEGHLAQDDRDPAMGTRWGGDREDRRGKRGSRGRETCPWELDCRIGFIQLCFLHKLKIEPLYCMRLRMCVYLYVCVMWIFCECACMSVCVSVCDCLWTPWERPWEDNGAGDAWEFSLMCRWWVAASDSHRQPNRFPYNTRIWTHLSSLFCWKTVVRVLMGTQAYYSYCASSAFASASLKLVN